MRQAKVEIVELSHTTTEGHDMIEAHKLLLCLAEHFASSLKTYQVWHPRNTPTSALTQTRRTHGRTDARARSRSRSVSRSNRAHDDACEHGRGGAAAAQSCAVLPAQAQLARCFGEADADGDGLISRAEFIDLVKKELPFWPRGKVGGISPPFPSTPSARAPLPLPCPHRRVFAAAPRRHRSPICTAACGRMRAAACAARSLPRSTRR